MERIRRHREAFENAMHDFVRQYVWSNMDIWKARDWRVVVYWEDGRTKLLKFPATTLDVDNLGEHLWSGARDRWNDADDNTREAVFERILNWFDSLESDEEIEITQINDAIWFDCDDLFFPEEDGAGECEATPVMDTIMDGMALLSIFAMFAIVFF